MDELAERFIDLCRHIYPGNARQGWPELSAAITAENAADLVWALLRSSKGPPARAVEMTIAAWSRIAPEEALEFTRNLPEAMRATAFSGALATWAFDHRAAAVKWAAELTDDRERREARLTLLPANLAAAYFRANPHRPLEASRLAESIGFWNRGGNKATDLAEEIFRTLDLSEVPAELQRIRNPDVREQAMRAAVGRIEDPEKLKTWVESLPDSDLRGQALERAAEELSVDDPDGTLAWLKTHAQGALRERLLSTVGRRISKNDPERAAAMIADIISPSARAALVESLVGNWTKAAPEDFERWLEHQKDPSVKAVARDAWMRSLSEDDPIAAARLCASLPPTSASQDLVNNLATVWAKRDPAAASAWAKQTSGTGIYRDVAGIVSESKEKKDPEAPVR